MDRSKKIYFSRRMLSNEHIGKKYLDRLKESNAINLENNYKILIVKNKYIQILPLNNYIIHSDPNKSSRLDDCSMQNIKNDYCEFNS
mgnify:CR=1 FL=1